MQEGSRKAIVAAFLANLGIAIAKFVGFLITASASLLAEAAHSLADTGNQALLLLGGSRAKR
ncbi:MAG: cation transporter, partial [Acidobacteria bacterium]|nr:cation transporter [Acidobacteriota bacterium]